MVEKGEFSQGLLTETTTHFREEVAAFAEIVRTHMATCYAQLRVAAQQQTSLPPGFAVLADMPLITTDPGSPTTLATGLLPDGRLVEIAAYKINPEQETKPITDDTAYLQCAAQIIQRIDTHYNGDSQSIAAQEK